MQVTINKYDFFHIILLSLGNTCSEENEIYLELFNMAVKTLNLGPKSIHTDTMCKDRGPRRGGELGLFQISI